MSRRDVPDNFNCYILVLSVKFVLKTISSHLTHGVRFLRYPTLDSFSRLRFFRCIFRFSFINIYFWSSHLAFRCCSRRHFGRKAFMIRSYIELITIEILPNCLQRITISFLLICSKHPKHLRQSIYIKIGTGLPAYSDIGFSDIPATVTVFWSKKGSPYTENPGYSDILLTLTVFGRPNPVTVSGEACSAIYNLRVKPRPSTTSSPSSAGSVLVLVHRAHPQIDQLVTRAPAPPAHAL